MGSSTGRQAPAQSLTLAAASAAVSLAPLWRAPRPVRAALVGLPATVTAVGVFVALRRPEALDAEREPLSPLPAAAFGAGAAGLVGASVASGITLDRLLEQWLRGRGIKRPRLLIAGVGGALAYAIDVLDRANER